MTNAGYSVRRGLAQSSGFPSCGPDGFKVIVRMHLLAIRFQIETTH